MINVIWGTAVERQPRIVEATTTLRSFLKEVGVAYENAQMQLDGTALQPGDLDKTFSDFGIKDECFLLNVAKADDGI